ncbi:unnamed protein product [Pleuronectes platessa]|uniref:Uncharacterized protein n=1 Tax=Pleuronectes platessa TaxID=8262 RepID=A0A9N7UQL2_PLEPL|nr:unnamed protein product [Pleuronectes platessa]
MKLPRCNDARRGLMDMWCEAVRTRHITSETEIPDLTEDLSDTSSLILQWRELLLRFHARDEERLEFETSETNLMHSFARPSPAHLARRRRARRARLSNKRQSSCQGR